MACSVDAGPVRYHGGEVRVIASIVNLRMREEAEVLTFIYSNKGGKDGSPKVRVFDKAGGELKGMPTNDWATLAEVDQGEGSDGPNSS